MARGIDVDGRGVKVTAEAVESGVIDEGLPVTKNWETPTVADDGSRSGDGHLTVDDDTGTYCVLDSGDPGYITHTPPGEYKNIRYDFNSTSGNIHVDLVDEGVRVKENWNPNGSGWYEINLETKTGGSILTTTSDYKVTVDDSTNKRVAETDVDTDV